MHKIDLPVTLLTAAVVAVLVFDLVRDPWIWIMLLLVGTPILWPLKTLFSDRRSAVRKLSEALVLLAFYALMSFVPYRFMVLGIFIPFAVLAVALPIVATPILIWRASRKPVS